MQKAKRGQVWFVDLKQIHPNTNVQAGQRPVLIVSNDTGNLHSNVCNVVPMTTQEKPPLPTHCKVFYNNKESTILCEQILCIDQFQLSSYYGTLSEEEMAEVDKCLAVSLNIKQEKVSLKDIEEQLIAFAKKQEPVREPITQTVIRVCRALFDVLNAKNPAQALVDFAKQEPVKVPPKQISREYDPIDPVDKVKAIVEGRTLKAPRLSWSREKKQEFVDDWKACKSADDRIEVAKKWNLKVSACYNYFSRFVKELQ